MEKGERSKEALHQGETDPSHVETSSKREAFVLMKLLRTNDATEEELEESFPF